MKVWFDHQIFSIQRYGGISRYFVELMQSLNKLDGLRAEAVAPAHVNAYLRAAGSKNLFSFELQHPQKGLRYRPQLTAPVFKLAQIIGSPDIVHETHYILGSEHISSQSNLVSTCHDMIFEKHPQWVPGSEDRARLKKKTYDRADAIICISEHTRDDLLDLYPQFASKVFTVHHGVDHTPAPDELPIQLPTPYLLFVGVRQGYKNFDNLLRALGRSAVLRNNFQLLCFGGGALTQQERLFAQKAGFQPDRMHHLSGSDELLSYVYKRASAFVFPSLYEGFGMPLTEAMVHGCPIVCSDASCFPEICGDVGTYFNGEDPDGIAHAIEAVVETSDRRTEPLLARSRQFSWQRCAEQTANAYRSII